MNVDTGHVWVAVITGMQHQETWVATTEAGIKELAENSPVPDPKVVHIEKQKVHGLWGVEDDE